VNALAGLLLIAAIPPAVANWWARWHEQRPLEWITKPVVTSLVIAAAMALDPRHEAMRWWFVVAFALCLLGDIFLMVSADLFVAGLAAFLVAHLVFVPGFVAGGLARPWLAVVALVLAVANGLTTGRGIVRGAGSKAAPVAAYVVVISLMFVVAWWHGNGWSIAGATLFVVSDSILGRRTFLPGHDTRASAVTVMVTYHLALASLVLALV